MTDLHPTLRRMLRRRGLAEKEAPSPEQWADFLAGLSRNYADLDGDRYMIERAFTVSSSEMTAILRAALDTMLDGVLVVDAEWRHVSHNRRFIEMWQLPAELLQPGRDAERVAHVAQQLADPGSAQLDALCSSKGPMAPSYSEIRLRDGRVIEWFIAPIVRPTGGFFGHLLLFRDVTGDRGARAVLERQEESLRDALALAERASRAKTDFLSNMSHEMRTPLNSIIGFSQVLGDEESGLVDPSHREFVGYIHRAGEHMLHLVNDLLDLRRIEEKKDSLELELQELAPLVSAAVSMVRPLIDERRHRVVVAVPPGQIRCDGRALVQVLVNLLSNAAKFTPSGGEVELRAELGSDLASFDVIDSGVGIDPAHHSILFTYFTQVGAKHRHGMKGSGVGLALTRSLVEAMGGTIDFTSRPGAGSTFRVRLPGAGASAAAAAGGA